MTTTTPESNASTASYSPPSLRAGIDLFLDKNEGPRPRLDGGGLDADALAQSARRYPDASRLTRLIAGRLGVDAGRVLLTAGGDDAIDRLCRLTLSAERALVTHEPTFEMIPIGARRCSAPVRSVEWARGAFPCGGLIERIDEGVGLVALVTPNNPTGLAIPRGDVVAVAEAAGQRGVPVLLDLAYTEFADEDLFAACAGMPNVAIVRTLSKAWGLAGLRVGYMVAEPGLVRRVRDVGGPYAVSGLSLAVAERALADEAGAGRTVARVRRERADLAALIRSLGGEALESQANFVLSRWRDAGWVCGALASLGIAVRAFAGRAGLEDALRITCPTDEADSQRLAGALAASVRPEAVLFDLDGVIADVSRSYRRAIVDTARTFGVELTPEDIRAAKAAGDANNDWVLTRRLMAARGVEATLAQVTERFEAIYQGTAASPGLWSLETTLVTRATLESIAGRARLAIVTGRPRADAERFLEANGLGGLFETLVCMEDGPAKPDPAVVRLAMGRLGVRSAWMIGDTPDDIVAARRAGVVPVGVPAPGDDSAEASRVLESFGAARVLRSVSDLLEILP